MYSELWNSMFERLERYKAKYGNCRVPPHFEEDLKLGTWVMNQRTNKRKKSLSQDRIDRLDSIGFEWSVRTQESWDAVFERLVKYKERHGDCLVPTDYSPDRKLARWVKMQRYRRALLSREREERLESIGFQWCIRIQQETWNGMYERLVAYQKKHGNCRVKQSQHQKLGVWVSDQRYKKKKGRLSPERVKLLDEIGFAWRV